MTIPCSEGGIDNVLIPYSHLVISILEIYFRILQLIEKIINPWQRILVLDSDLIQLLKINAQPQRPIFILHEQYWGSPQ